MKRQRAVPNIVSSVGHGSYVFHIYYFFSSLPSQSINIYKAAVIVLQSINIVLFKNMMISVKENYYNGMEVSLFCDRY